MKIEERKRIYPEEGESWTGITVEELKKNGFKENGVEGVYSHPKLESLKVMLQEMTGSWSLNIPYIFVDESGRDKARLVWLKDIKYMYQVDNMFHGFTDRWLGFI